MENLVEKIIIGLGFLLLFGILISVLFPNSTIPGLDQFSNEISAKTKQVQDSINNTFNSWSAESVVIFGKTTIKLPTKYETDISNPLTNIANVFFFVGGIIIRAFAFILNAIGLMFNSFSLIFYIIINLPLKVMAIASNNPFGQISGVILAIISIYFIIKIGFWVIEILRDVVKI